MSKRKRGMRRRPVPKRVWKPMASRIAAAHGIKVNQLLWFGNPGHTTKFHQARRAFWRAIRDLGEYSFPAIADISGHHHTGVIRGLRRAPPSFTHQEQSPCL